MWTQINNAKNYSYAKFKEPFKTMKTIFEGTIPLFGHYPIIPNLLIKRAQLLDFETTREESMWKEQECFNHFKKTLTIVKFL